MAVNKVSKPRRKSRIGRMERDIFRCGSTTFYYSSLLFPKNVRRDIFDLYSFVRVADDYVDELPQQPERFYELQRRWRAAIKNTNFDTSKRIDDSLHQRVVKNMIRLTRAHNFDPKWVDNFLDSMQSDLRWLPATKRPKGNKSRSRQSMTADELLFYIHGSAETIGLMLARIMGVPPATSQHAQLLGRSLQAINFIRDIQQDNLLGRCYFVSVDLQKFHLKDLSLESAQTRPEAFQGFIRSQIKDYQAMRREATRSLDSLPLRCRISVQIAVALYDWTAAQIAADPLLVFRRKLKPSKLRILTTCLNKIIITGIFRLPSWPREAG